MELIKFIQDLYIREPLMVSVIFGSISIFLLFLFHIILENKKKKNRLKHLKSKEKSKIEPSVVNHDDDDEPKSISQPGKPIQWVQLKKAPKDDYVKTIKELKERTVDRIVDPQEMIKNEKVVITEPLSKNVIANILVVDDALVIRKKISDLLKVNKYGVILKNDGWEAYSFLNELVQHSNQKPDLIITDIEMPNMTGIELIAAIKKINALEDIPIIVVSSHIEVHLSLIQEGKINGFISKPFADEDLINQINYLLD